MARDKKIQENIEKIKKKKLLDRAFQSAIADEIMAEKRRSVNMIPDEETNIPEGDFYSSVVHHVALAQRKRLPKLNLSGGYNNEYKIVDLPDALFQLSFLKSLNLSNNLLTALPDQLTKLTQLESIDLSGNSLTSFPVVLTKLPNLRSVNLASNKFVGQINMPIQFEHLESLNLSGNGLVEIPDFVGKSVSLKSLNLSCNLLTKLPGFIGNLVDLEVLDLSLNELAQLPEIIGNLTRLQSLNISYNSLTVLPALLGNLRRLRQLGLHDNSLTSLPEELGNLDGLQKLNISSNQLTDFPASLSQLNCFDQILYLENPLNSELEAAHQEGRDAVKAYLQAKAESVTLNEAKLILVGEGEVGKSCLLSALRSDVWEEGRPTTHGIEIKPVKLTILKTGTEITLNGWDFGGQRVYRPTHQLFFSAPAVYLVVWKPREGPQQGFVKEWIQLIKRREPSAKIIVVATHGGPQQRQPDIDRQELWDAFGKETVVDFFFVDSKPDKNGVRKGIDELKKAIARVAAELPEVGRSVPKSFSDVRAALQAKNVPYLPLDEVLAICHANNMDDRIAHLFITISHRLGHLTHYENDPALHNIVILRPDWLATAMSYILDDEATRFAHGLVKFSRLSQLWNDQSRPVETQYSESLHKVFLRLMERFDMSYRVAGLFKDEDTDPVSLIAQLVPDNIPEGREFEKGWLPELEAGDIEQTQICRIVDDKSQSANAEGLFYQLIVRLHKYSLGRVNYNDSIHWQRGLVLDADYNGRALLRHIGNDVHITVRAPYPERFLGMLTEEVKYLVESFWEGLRCDVTVPCLNSNPCVGLFEVEKLIENKKRGRPEVPCNVCNEWQDVGILLRNAPAASQSISIETLENQLSSIENKLDTLDVNVRRIRSQTDKNFDDLFRIFTDEAKEGPRLFSLFPVDGDKFNPQNWVRAKFRLVLWCEHSRLPLPALNRTDMTRGIYNLEFDREWFQKAVPYLKFLTGTLSLVLPVASSTLKVANDTAFKTLENQFSLGKNVIDAMAGTGRAFGEIMGDTDLNNLENGVGIRAENSTLRELHTLLKAKDPGFGGLVRVMNKRQEFMWVHERFAGEY